MMLHELLLSFCALTLLSHCRFASADPGLVADTPNLGALQASDPMLVIREDPRSLFFRRFEAYRGRYHESYH
jgi:hypothetical protein